MLLHSHYSRGFHHTHADTHHLSIIVHPHSPKIHVTSWIYANIHMQILMRIDPNPFEPSHLSSLTMRFTGKLACTITKFAKLNRSRWSRVASANRARFVRTSFRQTVEMEKWRISSTGTRVSIVIEKWARPESGNGRALFALEQWGSIKSRGFVYSRIIHLRVRRTNGCDLWAERVRHRAFFFAV